MPGKALLPERRPLLGSAKKMRSASMVYRLGEIIVKGDKAGDRLERLFREVLGLPEMKKKISTLLNRLEKIESLVWEKAVEEFLTEVTAESELVKDASDGFDVCSAQKAKMFLDRLGWKGSLPQFAAEVRNAICELFQKIIAGDLPEDLFERLSELGEARKARELVFGKILGKIPDDMAAAATMLRERMLDSPQLLVAVELMEHRAGQAVTSPAFSPAWQNVNQRSLGRLKKKYLRFPRQHNYPEGSRDWADEEEWLQEFILEELFKRISKDPRDLLKDQWQGKLGNSLCLAAEHRAIDHIRYLKAKKRDVLEVSLESEFTAEGRDGGDALSLENAIPSKDPGPAEQVERDDEYARLLAGLSAAEVEVMRQRFIEGQSVGEVARHMKKSESWVTKTQAAAISKMRRRREGFGVAKKLPKTGKNQKGGQNNGEITHKR